jgi:hypothetical protein
VKVAGFSLLSPADHFPGKGAMELTALARTVLIDRLVALEADAAHLTALAAVADAYAHVAREKADTAQRTLSEVKVWLALLPDDARLELRAPKPASASPARSGPAPSACCRRFLPFAV